MHIVRHMLLPWKKSVTERNGLIGCGISSHNFEDWGIAIMPIIMEWQTEMKLSCICTNPHSVKIFAK